MKLLILIPLLLYSDVIFNEHVTEEVVSVFVVVEEVSVFRAPMATIAECERFWLELYEKALLECGLNVIARSKINSIIDEQRLSITGLFDHKQAYKVGKLASADAILFVTVRESIDSTYTESIRLVNTSTGQICVFGDIAYKVKASPHPVDLRQDMIRKYTLKWHPVTSSPEFIAKEKSGYYNKKNPPLPEIMEKDD